MSVQPPPAAPVPPSVPASGHRSMVWGVGAGCGCLTLLAGLVAVVVILYAIGTRNQNPAPPPPVTPSNQPQPSAPTPPVPTPPAPTPPSAEPTPPSGAAQGVQVQIITVKVGPDRKTTTEQPSDTFQRGEVVGANVRFVAVPAPVELGWVWASVQGQHLEPVTQAHFHQFGPDVQGKILDLTLDGAGPGTYAIVVLVRGAGDQLAPVGSHQFTVQ